MQETHNIQFEIAKKEKLLADIYLEKRSQRLSRTPNLQKIRENSKSTTKKKISYTPDKAYMKKFEKYGCFVKNAKDPRRTVRKPEKSGNVKF